MTLTLSAPTLVPTPENPIPTSIRTGAKGLPLRQFGLLRDLASRRLERLVAIVHVENAASQRVIEKLGMSFVEQLHLWGIECYRTAPTSPGSSGNMPGAQHKAWRNREGSNLLRYLQL